MPDPKAPLFAYGSLQLPQVFEAVTGQSREGVPAVLRGFRRTRLEGFGFPAIIPAPQEETSGVVYLSLDTDAWGRLDDFEDDFYERKVVSVLLADGTCIEGCAYVLADDFRHLSLDLPWSLDDLHPETVSELLARL